MLRRAKLNLIDLAGSEKWSDGAANSEEMSKELTTEVLVIAALFPLAYQDLRLRIGPVVSASDASSFAGGISQSVGLTEAGRAQQAWASRGGYSRACEEVLLLGYWGGIGAARQSWDMLGLPLRQLTDRRKSIPSPSGY